MQRVVYDLTYATRGKSGIPNDARSIAEILTRIKNIEVDFRLSPKGFHYKRKKVSSQGPFTQSNLVNTVFQDNQGLFGKILNINLVRTLIQAISPWPYITLEPLTKNNVTLISEHLNLKNLKTKNNINISIMGISYGARFARPKILGRFRIKTKGVDFYLQQHIDPVKVNSKTKHIVRLHDILPITHPFFFAPLAQKAFKLGLS